MKEGVERIRQLVEQWDPEDLLRWAFVTFGGYVEIASGFGPEGMVLIDIAARVQPAFRIFTLDTFDFLFPETYRLMEPNWKSAYGSEWRDSSRRSLLRGPGACVWSRALGPRSGCLLQSQKGRTASQKALLKDCRRMGYQHQSARADPGLSSRFQGLSRDAKFHLVKINPLAGLDQLEKCRCYTSIRTTTCPTIALHDRGYPSIGCTHCTRSVQPGEDARAGRWSGFNKTECGLHTPAPSGSLVSIIDSSPAQGAPEA